MRYTLIYCIEAIYIIYMLNYFKTKTNFAHPLLYFDNPYLYHPIEKIEKEQNLICTFGQDASYVLAGYLILRGIALDFYPDLFLLKSCYHKYILFITLGLSLTNFNATIYLIPFLFYEFFVNI